MKTFKVLLFTIIGSVVGYVADYQAEGEDPFYVFIAGALMLLYKLAVERRWIQPVNKVIRGK